MRPTLLNLEIIVSSESNGEGSAPFANVPFEIDPSLRPSRTFHEGPPLCKIISKITFDCEASSKVELLEIKINFS